jgi:lysophospholipase L1-like esterase
MVLSEQQRTRAKVVVWLAAYVAACWIFVLVRDRLFLGVLGVFAIVGAARELHKAGHGISGARWFDGHPHRLFVLLVPGAALVAWWLFFDAGDGWGFFGLALLYIGLGLVVDRLRELRAYRRKWGPWILGCSGVLVLLGVGAMTVVGAAWTVWPVLLGLLISPFGLSLVSEARIRALWARTGPRRLHLALAGTALFAGGLVLMLILHVPGVFIAVLGGSVFVLMLAIAAKSNADVVIVVAMAAVIWTLTGSSVPVTDNASGDDGERVVVALGDSYISGEGADEYYDGTNDAGTNTCRRSPTAYPALLMLEDRDDVPSDLVFLACSGAKANGVQGQLRQFTQLREERSLDVEFVLLSVGGNDALFGNVGRTCLMPGECAELSAGWTGNLAQVGRTLDGLYADVRQAIPDAPVLVVPYPMPIREQSCEYSAFSDREHRFLFDFSTRLNAVVHRSAVDAGFYVVDTMPHALAGHRLCDGRAGAVGVNFFDANGVNGTLEQTVSPINWFHNSLHPNARGHEMMRAALLEWLDAHPDLDVVAPRPTGNDDGRAIPSPADDTGAAAGECQGLAGADVESCTAKWRVQEIGGFVITKGLIALLLAAGAWLLVLPMIHVSRMIFTVPDDHGVAASDAAEPRETADLVST